MKNSHFKMPYQFDNLLLIQDLSFCLESLWTDHFNKKDYEGEWTSISLRSASGKEIDVTANPNVETYIDTQLLNNCKYFQFIINQFECEKESIRLLSLSPGSCIKTHTDIAAGYESGFFRIHVPIKTDANVSFIVNGIDIKMKEGECWYANFNLPHSVQNKSTTNRVHLVIDCKRNDWSDKLFEEVGYDFEYEKQTNDYSIKTKRLMIEQLRLLKTPAADNIIEKLNLEISEAFKNQKNENT